MIELDDAWQLLDDAVVPLDVEHVTIDEAAGRWNAAALTSRVDLPVFDNMLQYVWFSLPELWRWRDIRVLHFQYEKPWEDHAKADSLRPLIELWRSFAGDGPVPDVDRLPDPPGRA